MSEGIDQHKRAMRAEVRERRQLLSERARLDAATGIRVQLDALVERFAARSISCFLSTTTEPGTREFVEGAVARGIRVLVPITRADGLLDWAVVTSNGAIGEGLFGLPEPVDGVLGPMAVGEVDLMVIPAATVSRDGNRLGWGRGYFDKTLGSMTDRPPVYAVVYDSEIIDQVPRDLHDQPVSGVVTPTQTLDLPVAGH